MSAGVGILITILIGFISCILFSLFADVGMVLLAETGSIKESLSISIVIDRIKKIGWGKYLGFILLIWLISCILLLVYSFIILIPFIGPIIGSLFIEPYIFMFLAYSLGLISSDI